MRIVRMVIWFVVLTILKNISQWEGWHPIYEMEHKIHVWNRQPVIILPSSNQTWLAAKSWTKFGHFVTGQFIGRNDEIFQQDMWLTTRGYGIWFCIKHRSPHQGTPHSIHQLIIFFHNQFFNVFPYLNMSSAKPHLLTHPTVYCCRNISRYISQYPKQYHPN